MESCLLCGTKLNKNEWKVYDEITDPDEICYCSTAKKIVKLQQENKKLRGKK